MNEALCTVFVYVRGADSRREFGERCPRLSGIRVFREDPAGYAEVKLTRAEVDAVRRSGLLFSVLHEMGAAVQATHRAECERRNGTGEDYDHEDDGE